MTLLNNNERKEMFEARQDEMWNLNSGFRIAEVICWQLLNYCSLNLFASSMAWWRCQSSNHQSLHVGVVLDVFCGILIACFLPLINFFAQCSCDENENLKTQRKLQLFCSMKIVISRRQTKMLYGENSYLFCNYECRKWGLHFGSNDEGVQWEAISIMYLKKP
jgi:hypothetical protein